MRPTTRNSKQRPTHPTFISDLKKIHRTEEKKPTDTRRSDFKFKVSESLVCYVFIVGETYTNRTVYRIMGNRSFSWLYSVQQNGALNIFIFFYVFSSLFLPFCIQTFFIFFRTGVLFTSFASFIH